PVRAAKYAYGQSTKPGAAKRRGRPALRKRQRSWGSLSKRDERQAAQAQHGPDAGRNFLIRFAAGVQLGLVTRFPHADGGDVDGLVIRFVVKHLAACSLQVDGWMAVGLKAERLTVGALGDVPVIGAIVADDPIGLE